METIIKNDYYAANGTHNGHAITMDVIEEIAPGCSAKSQIVRVAVDGRPSATCGLDGNSASLASYLRGECPFEQVQSSIRQNITEHTR